MFFRKTIFPAAQRAAGKIARSDCPASCGGNGIAGMAQRGGDDTTRRQRKTFRRKRNLQPKKKQSTDTSHCGGTPARRGGEKPRGGKEKVSAEGGICGEKGVKRGHGSLQRRASKARRGKNDAAAEKNFPPKAKFTAEKGIKRGHESLRRHTRKMRRGQHGAAKNHGRMKKKRHQSATNCKPKHKKKTRNISDPFFAIRAACAETFGTGAPLRYFRFYAGFSSRPVGKPRRRSVRAPPLLRDFYSLPSGYSEKYSVGEPNLRFLTPL